MSRSISVYRRKDNLVDLLVRHRAGKTGFRFGAASNFDAAFTTFATVPNYGLRSPSVPEAYAGSVGGQFRDQARFIFDPADYVATAAALIDTAPFFLRIEARNPDGSFDTPEAMHLILPPPIEPRRAINLRGTIPIGASLATALEIQLPGQCNDFSIMNDGGANMFVAFHPTGGEYQIFPVTGEFWTMEQYLTSISQIFVRGNGGTTTASMNFTLKNDPTV